MNIMYLVYYYTIGKPMEQDLLKAFGGAYVNASLAIITKLGRVQVLVMTKELQFWSFADFCVCCGFFHSIPLCKLSGHLFDSGVSVQGELASQMCKILHKCDIYMFYLEYI
ncbi:hypothetical protein BDL97_12G013500 [Sphagnum fallax]|nr:hypothetical protein BDL97_12G013500 [Sphagnum fallax]KAH8944943.1 hypothetical protein BDL97_12G013500 [Sphagnum fallax]KAH8944944.1 hypothetical protein BDL97_12G013500 [Sphagnum fallax]